MADDENRFPALPPRPDSETGEPFPPHGRAFRERDVKPEHDRDRDTRLSRKPQPPEGMGPVLAWYKESKRRKLTIYLCTFAILVVGLTVISFLDGDGAFDWVPYWEIWALIAVGSLLPTAPHSYWTYAAGADWFKYDIVRFGVARRSKFVKLYELQKISCSWATGGWHLQLMDGQRGIDLPLMDCQHDRRMWDLIYNGVLHSVAAGAKLDELTIKQLELDQVPELYDPTAAAGSMVELRDATRADAHAIADVLVQSWRAAYRDLLPDDVLAGLSVPDREQLWSEVLTTRPPHTRAVVATIAGAIVGFTATGPPLVPADRADATLGDLYALYLAPDVWRRGIGTQLHAAALGGLRSCGFTHAGLWILDTNEGAMRFYLHHGWTDTGRSQLDRGPGGVELHERRLHRDLSD